MKARPIFCAMFFFVLSLTMQIETLVVAPRHDSAAWLFMGARQAHGQMPGRDLWDNKLPLIYLVGRAAMATGHPPAFLWILEAALTAGAAIAIVGMLRSGAVDDRHALLAGALLCVLSGHPSLHGGGYMTEVYAMPLSAVAAWLTVRAACHGSMTSGFCSGLFWMLAISFRLPLSLVVMAVATVAILLRARLRGEERVARFWPAVGSAFVGGFVACLLILLHPVIAGYTSDCLQAAVLWPLGWADRSPGPLTLSTTARLADFGQDVLKLGWIHGAAVVGLFLAWRRGRSVVAAVTAAWYVGALGSAALGWASYAHYQYVALAPACIGCGLLLQRAGSKSGQLAIGLLAVSIGAVGFLNVKNLIRSRPASDDADRTAVVALMQEQTRADQTVFVWAWGRSADLLYRIDRSPGNRHFLAHSYFNMDMRLFEEMVESFLASPPLWIIEDRERNSPPLVASTPREFEFASPALVRLQAFVREAYVTAKQIGRYRVLRRSGSSSGEAPFVGG